MRTHPTGCEQWSSLFSILFSAFLLASLPTSGVVEALPLSTAGNSAALQATLPPTRLIAVSGQADPMEQVVSGEPFRASAVRFADHERGSCDFGTGEPSVIFAYALADVRIMPPPPAASLPSLPATMTVPEPSLLLLVGSGVLGLAGIAWRRRTRA